MDFERAKTMFDENKLSYGIQFEAKDEQINSHVDLNGKNVLGFLPTGYGKAACMIIPSVIRNDKESIIMVVSPLVSLMDDQMLALGNWGFSCYKAGIGTQIDSGNFKGIVFFSPETLQSSHWRKTLLSPTWQKKVCLIVIDEAHCISEWRESFRKEYQQLGTLRSLFKVPFMALTATCSQKVKDDIMLHLQLHNIDTDTNLNRLICQTYTFKLKKKRSLLDAKSTWSG